MQAEAKLCEEKAAKAMVDAARLAEELRGEQDVAQQMEKARKILEAQSKDMAQRLDEAESNALKGGKKAMNKMETRVRELESELDAESRRQADALKNLRRSERRINELTFASDEDRKNHERMQSLVDGLQGKIKTYKKQIEEAEEIAALNLAKFRKVAGEIDTAAGRADVAEQAVELKVGLVAKLAHGRGNGARELGVLLRASLSSVVRARRTKRPRVSKAVQPEAVGQCGQWPQGTDHCDKGVLEDKLADAGHLLVEVPRPDVANLLHAVML